MGSKPSWWDWREGKGFPQFPPFPINHCRGGGAPGCGCRWIVKKQILLKVWATVVAMQTETRWVIKFQDPEHKLIVSWGQKGIPIPTPYPELGTHPKHSTPQTACLRPVGRKPLMTTSPYHKSWKWSCSCCLSLTTAPICWEQTLSKEESSAQGSKE